MAAGGVPRVAGPGGVASGPRLSAADAGRGQASGGSASGGSASGGSGAGAPGEASAAIRLDKWLFHARFAKSRGVAAKLVDQTGVRVNGARASKPAQSVRPGDVLTFALGTTVRVVRVLAPGTRRGPAPEARTLYEDLAPPPDRSAPPDPAEAAVAPPAPRDRGAGRPTGAERRALDRLRGRDDG
ncbi:MAG: RNA-binding S4 domain-containing protein [Pseudomonadota bacterium]|nr:RNA-binding S4 domain-containing protein [Pseudomonadota bacterium]